MRYLFTSFLILIVSVGCINAIAQTIVSTGHQSAVNERTCLSLRVLANLTEKEVLSPEAENLAYIGWIEGFVVDPENKDIILIGCRTTDRPALHVDDLVVGMRNVWNREDFPYCSLDPRPADVLKINELMAGLGNITDVDQMHSFLNEFKEAWGPQIVVVGGVPLNSRHAHVMIDADYHMKKVSQGLVQVEGIHSYLDLILNEAKGQITRTGQIPQLGVSMSRFWFHIGGNEPTFQEGNGIVCIERCSVVLLTEKQRTTMDGLLYDAVEDDPLASAFAREFSEQFQEATTRVPEYADLENLFRLNAVLRAMHFRDAAHQAGLDLGFWLKEYRYKRESTMPLFLPGLTNSREVLGEYTQGGLYYQYVLFPMTFGGVSMEINIDEHCFDTARIEQMDQLREIAITSRPDPQSLSWQLLSEYN